jgi:hypothetical protein
MAQSDISQILPGAALSRRVLQQAFAFASWVYTFIDNVEMGIYPKCALGESQVTEAARRVRQHPPDLTSNPENLGKDRING